MGEVLETYPSLSNPNREYQVIRGDDGVVYCTCWQWKKNRTCRHLEHYSRTMEDEENDDEAEGDGLPGISPQRQPEHPGRHKNTE